MRSHRLLACLRPPRFQDDQGFPGGDFGGDFDESLPAADVLHVHDDHVDVVVLVQVLEDIRFADVHLVPDGGDDPEVHDIAKPDQDAGGVDPGLGDHADIALPQIVQKTERLHHVVVGVDDARAVRPEEAASLFTDDLFDPSLGPFSFLPAFGETGGLDHQEANPLPAAVLDGGRDIPGRDDNDRQINRIGNIQDRAVAVESKQGFFFQVHRVQLPRKMVADQVPEDVVSELLFRIRRPEHRDAAGIKEIVQVPAPLRGLLAAGGLADEHPGIDYTVPLG